MAWIKCKKCNGTGARPQFGRVEHGRCFYCVKGMVNSDHVKPARKGNLSVDEINAKIAAGLNIKE